MEAGAEGPWVEQPVVEVVTVTEEAVQRPLNILMQPQFCHHMQNIASVFMD